ncbi:transglycosylase domain-containing protein, partial [Candidatus Collierbacteria bacterium]|nr:transglycosylase domain-containing protein [Candidatus Collierbacteria bacterium]
TGKRLEGGSTITQQLVKNALLADTNRTITRKIREAVLSLITEFVYTKDQILEMYLNQAPYGGTTYGIETASQIYFGKSAKNLSVAEAALLAGLPQAPTKYSPFGANPDLAINRQRQVLRRMNEDGYLSKEQLDEAQNQKLIFVSKKSTIKAPHFSLMVRDKLVDKYGEDLVNLGGLRVTTSLDLDLQDYAQASLTAEIKKLAKLKIGNGAALVTRPTTGEILAMIGSSDYFDLDHDGNVNITTRLRQPGSSIKPINYAAGLLNGWTASTMFLDLPTCFNVVNQKQYCPKNYDNTFRGGVQMRFALGNSLNIPAVKMLALNGIESFIATASAMGITTFTDPSLYGLSLTLGGGEVLMTDMAVAFGSIQSSRSKPTTAKSWKKIIRTKSPIMSVPSTKTGPLFGEGTTHFLPKPATKQSRSSFPKRSPISSATFSWTIMLASALLALIVNSLSRGKRLASRPGPPMTCATTGPSASLRMFWSPLGSATTTTLP